MASALPAGLRVHQDGAVGWLEFDRPDAGNAFDGAILDALPGVWHSLDADPSIRAVVVIGSGRAFQTGLDVRQLAKDPQALKAASRRTRNGNPGLTGWHLKLGVPVVAAINGICAGGGLHYVVDADIVIASTAASFLDPHVSVGQVSAYESIGLARRGAFGEAARLALLGAHGKVDAERARQVGWVSEVVPPERLRARASELAHQIAAQARERTREVRAALWCAQEVGRSEAIGRRSPE
ncbi:enoyl-CoA hydratase/isomerase family protein [Humibacter sp.]|uniref:enoyl-CoA hydratase/isomerase family protein n=1 Tax=Humibacter sp. TaxID=1940291 RepID=UPI002C3C6C96|nr:enoyl-CoA hydratase/isomerase family protein [Humibacter sp.]HVX09165.1 enoyl-CoA hydratase/isomerase family protein [Humibacter sp.]